MKKKYQRPASATISLCAEEFMFSNTIGQKSDTKVGGNEALSGKKQSDIWENDLWGTK